MQLSDVEEARKMHPRDLQVFTYVKVQEIARKQDACDKRIDKQDIKIAGLHEFKIKTLAKWSTLAAIIGGAVMLFGSALVKGGPK